MFVGDVVLSFGVDEQGGQQERLVQLILQVNVVEACRGGTRAKAVKIAQKRRLGDPKWKADSCCPRTGSNGRHW